MRNLRLHAAVLALAAACGASETEGDHELGARGDDPGKHTGQIARVMTRNLYLGADLAPAITATSLPAFLAGTGAIFNQVEATSFPVRVEGLAAEIRGAKPDLVGLQEVALWRTGPVSFAPLQGAEPTASTVRYDFLALLLAELDAGHDRYRPVVVQEEFDFEAPADIDGNGTPDLNARLTMRDVILERVGGGVRTWNPQGDSFANLLVLSILGTPLEVTRGWTAVDARVRGTAPFRFVNTHLEAFHPGVRALQAGELVAPGGPATGDLPVVLVGDLNSDDDTVTGADRLAYLLLLGAGFVSRSTDDPLSCCISSYDLTTGTVDEFDHQVDHIMTNAPGEVTLVESFVTGREMVNGYWNSDHAGVVSALRIR